jgi:hypothetical protein
MGGRYSTTPVPGQPRGMPTGGGLARLPAMTRSRLSALLAASVAALALTFGWLSTPPPAAALCASPVAPAEALRQASVAFVGTVTAVTDGGYTATFTVEEIWKGPNLSEESTVYGGSPSIEDSRTWQSGQRYLVFPSVDRDGNLLDTACSPTGPYRSAYDALRPASAHAPQGPPTSGPPGDAPIAAVFLLILLLGSLGAFLLWRTGRVEPVP